jgi:hypothetical protein
MNSEEAMKAYLAGQISLHAVPMELGRNDSRRQRIGSLHAK